MRASTTTTELHTNRKHPPLRSTRQDELSQNSTRVPSAASTWKKHSLSVLPPWSDIPDWKSSRSPLLEMPLEILDKIFGNQSGLLLQDHLALAGTCRSIRNAYTGEVWMALHLLRHYHPDADTCAAARHIFSATLFPIPCEGSLSCDNESFSLISEIALEVNEATITRTNARFEFKITDKEIYSLPFRIGPNPHNHDAEPIKLFRRAQVYSLAMRVHGGPLGHQAYLKRLADQNATCKAMRTRTNVFQSWA